VRPLPERLLLAVPVLAALLLGAGLILLASITARTLRERDDAVKQGVLLRLGHNLEAELRESGPEDAAATLRHFVGVNGASVAGAELVGPQGVFVREGTVGPAAVEQPAMLGPGWRSVMGMAGRGGGPGRGTPGTLRLQPTPELGRAGALAGVVMVGAVVAAIGLVAFSLVAVSGLAQRRRLAAAEAERRRLEVLALAGAGLAHRIRNPLAGIKGTAQLILEGGQVQTEARVRRILDATERIETLVGRLLAFARPPEASPEELDLAAIASQVAARAPGRVRVAPAGAVGAWADREHVESILEELLANARAFDVAGELEVHVGREGRHAIVEVRDRGPGPAVTPERAFDPYVTTRADGTGLGLAIVRTLAQANGGEVALSARPGGGCAARLTLPAESG
jgi:two-component system sensor histidine kinase HydH